MAVTSVFPVVRSIASSSSTRTSSLSLLVFSTSMNTARRGARGASELAGSVFAVLDAGARPVRGRAAALRAGVFFARAAFLAGIFVGIVRAL